MPRLRVACFGAGWVTTHRHIPAMRADGRFEIVALVDRRGDRAREAAEHLGVPRSIEGTSFDDRPALADIDVVTCGTAPFTHFDVVHSALEHGRHVITDKPFTMTIAEGETLVDTAARARRHLAIVHNFQFARCVRQVDGWIRRGRLGAVRAVWAMQLSNPRRRLPAWYDELPLGLFYDESPHLLYLVRHFVSGVPALEHATVVPSSSRPGANTPAQLTAQYGGRTPVTLTMNFEAPVSEWHVIVFGEEALAAIDVFRDIAAFVPNDGVHGTYPVLRTSLRGTAGHWLGYVRSGPRHLRGTLRYGNDEVFRRFGDAVESGIAPAGISAGDALAVLRAQHELLAASVTP
jgi:predicted dehydrogenase